MMVNIDEIVDYYSNLLIIQYHNKPKAKATIELLVRELLASGILFDIRDGYNLDTAVGVQLDILGKYIGVDRFFTRQDLDGFFSFAEYSDIAFGTKIGFSDYADFETKPGKWLQYEDVVSDQLQLTDDDYRIILKLKIVQNNSNHSHKSIDDSMNAFFGDEVVAFSEGDMEMTYLVPASLTPIIEVAIQKEVLPKPMGVLLKIIDTFPGIFLKNGAEEFSDDVVFTRSSSATFIDAVGGLQLVALNIPRFTFG